MLSSLLRMAGGAWLKVTHHAPHWGQFMVKVIFDKLEGDS